MIHSTRRDDIDLTEGRFAPLLLFPLVAAHPDGGEHDIRSHHPNIVGITLFAESPDIVTPVGIAVAPDGRVFVQENHTHQRPDGYDGPEKDRILVFEDTDRDGVADRRSVFHDGLECSTDPVSYTHLTLPTTVSV